ncbi:MAG: energy transducer TonB [Bacteroidota bacterium]
MSKKTSVIYADLTDMVFEDRERNYGAYDLRRRYQRNVLLGLGITSALVIAFAFSGTLSSAAAPDDGLNKTIVEFTDVELPLPPVDPPVDVPPPPPPPPPAPKVRTLEFLPPDPAPADEADKKATMHAVDSLKLIKVFGTSDQEGEVLDDLPFDFSSGDGEEVPEFIQEIMPEADKFVVADEEPKPINMSEVSKAITYPQLMRDAGVEGMVVLRVLVDKSGAYKKHIVVNSPHPMLSEEVESHINKLKFTPAIQGNKPIYFWVNIPFNFKTIN